MTPPDATLITSVPEGGFVACGFTNSRKVVGSVDAGSAPLKLNSAVAFTKLLVLRVTVVPFGIPLPLISASKTGISC